MGKSCLNSAKNQYFRMIAGITSNIIPGRFSEEIPRGRFDGDITVVLSEETNGESKGEFS